MPHDSFHPDARPPRSFIAEAAERAFREGVGLGLVAGVILSGLVALIIYVL